MMRWQSTSFPPALLPGWDSTLRPRARCHGDRTLATCSPVPISCWAKMCAEVVSLDARRVLVAIEKGATTVPVLHWPRLVTKDAPLTLPECRSLGLIDVTLDPRWILYVKRHLAVIGIYTDDEAQYWVAHVSGHQHPDGSWCLTRVDGGWESIMLTIGRLQVVNGTLFAMI